MDECASGDESLHHRHPAPRAEAVWYIRKHRGDLLRRIISRGRHGIFSPRACEHVNEQESGQGADACI
jgi:hypothetical protein